MCGVFGHDGEIIDQALRILRLEVDDPRELAFVVRVVDVEPLRDELRMVVILGEDDGLAQAVPAGHFQAARHQVLQHLVHGIFVEQPAVYRLRLPRDPVSCRRRSIPAHPTLPFPLRTVGRR